MKHTKRIIFSIVILIGGTLIFASWAKYNFDLVFSDFEKIADTSLVKNKQEVIPNEIPVSNFVIMPKSNLVKQNDNQNIKEGSFEFVFPKSGSNVYQGCNYKVSWLGSSTKSVDFSLVDAGTREVIGPVTGGIPKNISGESIENFDWKVGTVWPGRYYLLASNINNATIEKRSAVFNINEVPSDTSKEDIAKLCIQ